MRRAIMGAIVGALVLGGAAGLSLAADADLAPLLPRPIARSGFAGYTTVPAKPGPFELTLTAVEEGGVGGVKHVSIGVPLLPGQCKTVSELQLLGTDAAGKPVELVAQFRELARFWRADNSLRWVLVDFADTFKPKETRTYVLTNRKTQSTAVAVPGLSGDAGLSVQQTPEAIAITTGPAKFLVNRKRFNVLDRVWIDANGDGQFAADETVLAGSPETGLVLEGTHGEKYFAADGVKSVEVIESGPLRVRVRARGVNKARGPGYSRGMYGYDVFMDFFAGSSDVALDLVLTNNFAQPIGMPTFEDASLLLKLSGGGTGYGLIGKDPSSGRLSAGESVCLYQDSNGADTWETCQGYTGTSAPGGFSFRGKTVAFRGYKVFQRSGGRQTEIGQGDHARGAALLSNDRGGMAIATRDFWQQFPKAVEVAADGTVRLGMFPRESIVPHYLEDCSAKGHEVVLHFFAPAERSEYAAGGQVDLKKFADAWDYRVYARPSVEHIAATGALTDLGPFTVPVKGLDQGVNTRIYEARRMFSTDQYYGNAFGWQVWGSRWHSHGGHSSRGARQPMRDDFLLYHWYLTGQRSWLYAGIARSRNFRDVRSYRVDGQDPFGFSGWATFRRANYSEDYSQRTLPKDAELQKYSQGFYPRAPWTLPNPAHMVLDLCYDRYLLFGDQRALENMRVIAAHGGFYVRDKKPFVHRESGWCLRTLERYWELTGDRDAEACLAATIKSYQALVGVKPLVAYNDVRKEEINWWFTQVFARGFAMTALHTLDPTALDVCRTLAESVEPRQGRYLCMLFAVLYHLTGEERYKQFVLGEGGAGESLLGVSTSGDWPANAHWLLHQPPRKAR